MRHLNIFQRWNTVRKTTDELRIVASSWVNYYIYSPEADHNQELIWKSSSVIKDSRSDCIWHLYTPADGMEEGERVQEWEQPNKWQLCENKCRSSISIYRQLVFLMIFLTIFKIVFIPCRMNSLHILNVFSWNEKNASQL